MIFVQSVFELSCFEIKKESPSAEFNISIFCISWESTHFFRGQVKRGKRKREDKTDHSTLLRPPNSSFRVYFRELIEREHNKLIKKPYEVKPVVTFTTRFYYPLFDPLNALVKLVISCGWTTTAGSHILVSRLPGPTTGPTAKRSSQLFELRCSGVSSPLVKNVHSNGGRK